MKKRNQRKGKFGFDKNGVMALSFGALNIADYMTTKKILREGGDELNPVADFLMKKKLFGIVKIATTLTGMLAIYVEGTPKIMTKTLLGFYGFVVANNVMEIVQHKREAKMNSV